MYKGVTTPEDFTPAIDWVDSLGLLAPVKIKRSYSTLGTLGQYFSRWNTISVYTSEEELPIVVHELIHAYQNVFPIESVPGKGFDGYILNPVEIESNYYEYLFRVEFGMSLPLLEDYHRLGVNLLEKPPREISSKTCQRVVYCPHESTDTSKWKGFH